MFSLSLAREATAQTAPPQQQVLPAGNRPAPDAPKPTVGAPAAATHYAVYLRAKTQDRRIDVLSRSGSLVAHCHGRCALQLAPGYYFARAYDDSDELMGKLGFQVNGNVEYELTDSVNPWATVGLVEIAAAPFVLVGGFALALRNDCIGKYASYCGAETKLASYATILTGVALVPIGIVTYARNSRDKPELLRVDALRVGVAASGDGTALTLSGRF